MTTYRQTFRTWGRGAGKGISGYVVADVAAGDAVRRVTARLERETGLVAAAGPAYDGEVREGDRIVATHYKVTLARPIPAKRGGGYSPEGEIWIALDTKEVG